MNRWLSLIIGLGWVLLCARAGFAVVSEVQTQPPVLASAGNIVGPAGSLGRSCFQSGGLSPTTFLLPSIQIPSSIFLTHEFVTVSPPPVVGVPVIAAAKTAADKNPIGNFGVVSKGIYRGQRLETEEEYRYLAQELGVTTIVNLEKYNHDDKMFCAKYGLHCVDYPLVLWVGQDAVFDWKTFKEAFRFVLARQKAGEKVFFHCKHGSDRAGALAAAIMIRERARGQIFDREKLWRLIDGTLHRHGFHKIYIFLHHAIKNWVFEFEEYPWLSEESSSSHHH